MYLTQTLRRLLPVCDDTKNLNETESEIFSVTKFLWYRIRYFFRYQIFENKLFWYWIWYHLKNGKISKSRCHPKYPNFEQNRNFSDTKFLRYRIQDFFRYQIFSISNPILFLKSNLFDTESETIKKMESFKTATSHSLVLASKGVMFWVVRWAPLIAVSWACEFSIWGYESWLVCCALRSINPGELSI